MQMAGLGTTVVFALAALLWLAYLVPVWVRRREYLATERNAVRLQQTLRIMAETAEAPPEVAIAASTRDIARQQRVVAKEARLKAAIERAEAVARARELDERIERVEREVRAAVAGSASRRQRLRRTRLACTLMLVASVGVGIAGAVLPEALALLVLAGVVAVLAVVGLAAVNRTNASLRVARHAPVETTVERDAPAAPARASRLGDAGTSDAILASRSWAPAQVPAQRPARPPIEVLRDHARRIVAEGEGAAITPIGASFEQLVTGEVESGAMPTPAASTAAATPAVGEPGPVHVPVPAPPSRFASMGVVGADDGAIDVGAAFRRRVG